MRRCVWYGNVASLRTAQTTSFSLGRASSGASMRYHRAHKSWIPDDKVTPETIQGNHPVVREERSHFVRIGDREIDVVADVLEESQRYRAEWRLEAPRHDRDHELVAKNAQPPMGVSWTLAGSVFQGNRDPGIPCTMLGEF